MNNEIMKRAGFIKEMKLVEQKKCPICEKEIIVDNFRDSLSRKEYKISGMYQQCQDKIFG